ncbi:SPOR domain-containing protein [Colwellia sp. 4_MG-2023]|uniref:SPOR domain-containing protein n=1 Tax=unclassified Colwellia TaxID=196834 RepID=UPI001C09B109|nr:MULTISPECIES: SPOR domain-containing protein [unclassified Colwellia]MBU2925436.1 SPOR domain-containing protein [Colwellia sp. C2M11]MDO6506394.1 SPOR domain-containing protein [Colwellia sp. 5_MG-2023]MDO6555218.1 SPOR domain-containing protein [Colwellia sp. 4_MG-2023]MDO6651596.1 SPOR domain-containing protein [Colwellia sp. 3_MG-2023]MDO6665006.1 SPOR domain-containing protein [Colwellia sp. 2_MG-2023]
MSNQDYISRTPQKKKKNSPYKKKSAQPDPTSTRKLKFLGLIAIIFISVFVYSLWFLKTDETTKTPIQTQHEVKPKKEKDLPEPPKEKWTYVENLKTKEIEVGQYEVKQNGPYKMQCGSFKTAAQAESLRAKIAFSGLESSIQTAQGKNNIWHKVVLGPYSRKRAAEQDKHKLRNNNINRCQIWLWK